VAGKSTVIVTLSGVEDSVVSRPYPDAETRRDAPDPALFSVSRSWSGASSLLRFVTKTGFLFGWSIAQFTLKANSAARLALSPPRL
jgi:hypothetical protein